MWSVCIFASRESIETLQGTVRAAADAAQGVVIDVLVNGNADLAFLAARHFPDHRVWHVGTSDKANAWNQYLSVWTPTAVAFFIDGYARVHRGALRHLDDAMRQQGSLAASGVPTMGRSARSLRRAMIANGGIHGNLFAIRGDVLAAMRDSKFRLPLGLYRTDPLIAAVCAYNLNPRIYKWDMSRVTVEPRASWDLASQTSAMQAIKRKLRQAQGVLENCAIRQHLSIERKLPDELPATAAELVRAWMSSHPGQAVAALVRNPACLLAARRLLQKKRQWVAVEPTLLT